MFIVTHEGYTTPEQSKRLQELGLPVYTADCFCRPDGKELGIYQPVVPCHPDSRIDKFIDYANRRYGRTYYIPVWSVGQLIKQITKATGSAMYIHPENTPMEVCMRYAEIAGFKKYFKEEEK